MLWVVSPVLHKLPVAADDVSITLPPQTVVGPCAAITGRLGTVFTTTLVTALVAEVQPEEIT